MKKALLALTALSLVLAACGGSGDSETEAAPTTTAAPATTTTTTTTAAPTTAAATADDDSGIFPSGDPDIDAVATAYMVAFDSTTDYEAKLPYVDDLSGLEETVVDYMAIGETMGGVTILMKSVEVSGDAATVLYDLQFNNNPIYPNLPGTAVRTDAGWQVTRAEFCSMMSSARVGCPAE